MSTEPTRASTVRIPLENGAAIYIEAGSVSGEEKVAIFDTAAFKDVTNAIEGIATALVTTFKKVKPKGASVEFGVDVGIEAGQLMTLLVRGTANATMKITLTWGDTEITAPTAGQ